MLPESGCKQSLRPTWLAVSVWRVSVPIRHAAILAWLGIYLLATLMLSGCAHWNLKVEQNYKMRQLEHKNAIYYAQLTHECDLLIKSQHNILEGHVYGLDPAKLKGWQQFNIINDLNPDGILLTTKGLSLDFSHGWRDCWIGWDQSQTQTNVWILTTNIRDKKKSVYEVTK